MLKKSFVVKVAGVLLTTNMLMGGVEAAQINTIIDTGTGMFAEPEKVYEQIDESIKDWFFPNKKDMDKMTFSEKQAIKANNAQHMLVPIAETDGIVQIYREEKGLAAANDSMMAGTSVRDMSMSRADMIALSKEFGADYVLYFRVTNTVPTMSVGFMSAGQKTNVTTDFRIFDNAQQKYVFVKRYQTTGSSNSFYAGMGSSSKAVRDGLGKALKQISKDRAKIIAVIK